MMDRKLTGTICRGEDMDQTIVPPTFRFAPSPNGYLHLGHAYSALLNASLALREDGRLLLRLEDIDLQRSREAYALAIEEDLAWLGLVWEKPVRRQSAHFATYAKALRGFEARGWVYPCFCTRGTVQAAVAGRPNWPADPDGVPLYPGLCRDLDPDERRRRIAAGSPYAWRLDMRAAEAVLHAPLDYCETGVEDGTRTVRAEPARWGDAIVGRKDVPTSYHLAVVIDDALQGVSHVVRGRDLLAATDLQRLIQTLLGIEAPRYHHHRLILDTEGRKLAKSRHATALRAARHAGASAEEIRRELGFA